jgi:AcrR family transcriptional regulator
MRSSDDRTTVARIRDAAITEFAANGVAGTSIRTIAAAAGVSPGLVIHHFGSKDELRVECDKHVATVIRELKSGAMAAGASFDPLAAMRAQHSGPPVAKYIARTLVDGSPHVAEIVDEMVADAEKYMEIGVGSGMIEPTRYPKERAAILTMWSLGALVLHEHLERQIGVDITADFRDDPKAATAYMAPALEIAGGFITDTTVQLMSDAFVATEQENQEKETT